MITAMPLPVVLVNLYVPFTGETVRRDDLMAKWAVKRNPTMHRCARDTDMNLQSTGAN